MINQFTTISSYSLVRIHKRILFWLIWLCTSLKSIWIFYKTKWTLFIFWIQDTKSNKWTRFLLCKLLFTYSLLDKGYRNRFKVCCFQFVLSKISWKCKTFRKITIDNSMKYCPQSYQFKSISGHIQPNTINNNSLPHKQNKKSLLGNKKFIEKKTGEGFRILRWIMNC